MNNQEAFDKMVTHAFTQKVRATNDGGYCQYRAPNGTKCFVGALMPDAEFKEVYESRSIAEFKDEVPAFKNIDGGLLSQAQCIHDSGNPSDWFEAFERLAIRFELNDTVLKSCEGIEL